MGTRCLHSFQNPQRVPWVSFTHPTHLTPNFVVGILYMWHTHKQPQRKNIVGRAKCKRAAKPGISIIWTFQLSAFPLAVGISNAESWYFRCILDILKKHMFTWYTNIVIFMHICTPLLFSDICNIFFSISNAQSWYFRCRTAAVAARQHHPLSTVHLKITFSYAWLSSISQRAFLSKRVAFQTFTHI